MVTLIQDADHPSTMGDYPTDAVLLAYGRAAYAYQLLETAMAQIFGYAEIGTKWTLGLLLAQHKNHPLLESNKTLTKALYKAMRKRNKIAHRLFLTAAQDWKEVAEYLTQSAAFFDALRLSLSQ